MPARHGPADYDGNGGRDYGSGLGHISDPHCPPIIHGAQKVVDVAVHAL